MKIGFVIDAVCDLPPKFIQTNKIHIIPTKIINEDNTYHDYKMKELTKQIYNMIDIKEDFTTDCLSKKELFYFFNKVLTEYDYDFLLVITTSSSRSDTYINCIEAAEESKKYSAKIRERLKLKTHPHIEVIDSHQISVGIGVLVEEAIKSSKEYSNPIEFTQHIRNCLNLVQTVIIPNDLHNLYFNPKNDNENESISFTDYLSNAINIKPIMLLNNGELTISNSYLGIGKSIGKCFEMMIKNIQESRVLHNSIHVAFGGSFSSLKNNSKYSEFVSLCKQHEISLYRSNISATLATHIGSNSLVVSFLTNDLLNHLLDEDENDDEDHTLS